MKKVNFSNMMVELDPKEKWKIVKEPMAGGGENSILLFNDGIRRF